MLMIRELPSGIAFGKEKKTSCVAPLAILKLDLPLDVFAVTVVPLACPLRPSEPCRPAVTLPTESEPVP